MEARHRSSRGGGTGTMVHAYQDDIENSLEYDKSNHESYSTTAKDRKFHSKSNIFGLVISVIILFTIGIVLYLRIDIVHVALSHPSSYSIPSSPNLPIITVDTPTEPVIDVVPPPEVEKVTDSITDSIFDSTDNTDTSATANVSNPEEELEKLHQSLEEQINVVRHLKFDENLVMEKDPKALAEIEKLQALAREYVPLRYGPEPYDLEMSLNFPESMPGSREEKLIVRLAPLEYMPYAVYYVLQIVDSWKVSII
jgi:hypothetical protein